MKDILKLQAFVNELEAISLQINTLSAWALGPLLLGKEILYHQKAWKTMENPRVWP